VDSSGSQIDQTWAKKGGFDSNLGRILTADGDFLTIEACKLAQRKRVIISGIWLAI